MKDDSKVDYLTKFKEERDKALVFNGKYILDVLLLNNNVDRQDRSLFFNISTEIIESVFLDLYNDIHSKEKFDKAMEALPLLVEKLNPIIERMDKQKIENANGSTSGARH